MYVRGGHIDSRIVKGLSLELPRHYSSTRTLLETIRVYGIDSNSHERPQPFRTTAHTRRYGQQEPSRRPASYEPMTFNTHFERREPIRSGEMGSEYYQRAGRLRPLDSPLRHTTAEADRGRPAKERTTPIYRSGQPYQPCPYPRCPEREARLFRQYDARSFKRPDIARGYTDKEQSGSRYVYVYD